jgi:hypothetical protein
MKKIVISLIALSFLFGVIAPAFAITESQCTMRRNANTIITGADCPAVNETSTYNEEYCVTAGCGVNGATCCLFSSIMNVTSWLFMLLMVIVTLLIVIGAASIVTSGGKEESVKKGRDYITYALVGLAAAFLSFMLPYILRVMIVA